MIFLKFIYFLENSADTHPARGGSQEGEGERAAEHQLLPEPHVHAPLHNGAGPGNQKRERAGDLRADAGSASHETVPQPELAPDARLQRAKEGAEQNGLQAVSRAEKAGAGEGEAGDP